MPSPENHTSTRIEKDSMGEMLVPADLLYGATTQRALMNFPIKELPVSWEAIHAFALLKKSAALANQELGKLEATTATLICDACDVIIESLEDKSLRHEMMRHFPVDVYQTGSGTSTNMNVNEVISNLACRAAGSEIGAQAPVHPNDHVNMGQSSNDTFPTAMHVAISIRMMNQLLPGLEVLKASLDKKAVQFDHLVKIGRTHLQDATPIRLGQEFSGFATQIEYALERTRVSIVNLASNLAIGGTAVGTGINTHPDFAGIVARRLSDSTGIEFKEARNHFEAQSTIDSVVDAHGRMKTIAVSLSKIASDLRLMACGPRCGLNELALPAVQPGSSIMPGKVNPVIIESMMQVSMQICGNDTTITMAGMGGLGSLLDLNVAMPLSVVTMLETVHLLANSTTNLAVQCVDGIEANEVVINDIVERSLMLGTTLAPELGYNEAAAIAKACFKSGQTIREYCLENNVLPAERLDKLLDVTEMTHPHL
jgi:fumarate hydratase class II